MLKTRLEKHNVCERCFGVGIRDVDCVCAYTNYKTITLEFEVCDCCSHLISDGVPADTKFNAEQLDKLTNL